MKYLSTLLILTMSIFMVACGDDDTKNIQSFTISQTNKVTSASSTSIYSAEYRYEIDYTSGKMNITAGNVRFSPMMPAITFTIKDIPFTYTVNGINLSATNVTPEVTGYDSTDIKYVITSISGRIVNSSVSTGITSVLTYTINDKYTVVAYPSPMLFEFNSETAVTGGLPFSSTDVYYAVKLDETTNTAALYIYGAKFAEAMQATNMVFRGINVEATTTGYNLSCEELIPSLLKDNATPAPMENYPISNVTATVIDDKMNLEFICTRIENDNIIGTYTVSANASILPTIQLN